jgi:ketosteroid isomerase-like protein
MSRSKTELVRLAFDAFNRRDLDAAFELMNEEVVFIAPTADIANEGEPYRGFEGMRKYYSDVERVWEQLEVTARELREVGEAVLVIGRVYGRGEGGYISDSPTQWVFKIQEERIVRIQVFTNRAAALAEVGLEE